MGAVVSATEVVDVVVVELSDVVLFSWKIPGISTGRADDEVVGAEVDDSKLVVGGALVVGSGVELVVGAWLVVGCCVVVG